MHQAMIRTLLGCADDSLLKFTDMTFVMWGRDMILQGECEGQPVQPFQLHTIDCREMKWQLFSHHHMETPVSFPTTEVVSFKIGQSHHRKSAVVLTEHFGLTWNYKTLHLKFGTVSIELE